MISFDTWVLDVSTDFMVGTHIISPLRDTKKDDSIEIRLQAIERASI